MCKFITNYNPSLKSRKIVLNSFIKLDLRNYDNAEIEQLSNMASTGLRKKVELHLKVGKVLASNEAVRMKLILETLFKCFILTFDSNDLQKIKTRATDYATIFTNSLLLLNFFF